MGKRKMNIRDLYLLARIAVEDEVHGKTHTTLHPKEDAAATRLAEATLIERNPQLDHEVRLTPLGEKVISGLIGNVQAFQ